MQILQDIFAEYVNMRTNGMKANDALNVLRTYIEPLDKNAKKQLAEYVRRYEGKHEPANAAPSPSGPQPEPKPIKSLKPTPADTPQAAEKPIQPEWLECPACKAKNRIGDVFCYSCGSLLDAQQEKFGTRQFSSANKRSPHEFGPDSVLVLRLRDAKHDYEIRPQVAHNEIVIGRGTENSAMLPDVDLRDEGAEHLGISRLHMALKYVPDDETIQIYDLGSANGSFVNGQKLHPKEVRILRDGDEIRLGRLVMRVIYMHPGNEV